MFRAIAVAIAIEWLSLITGCASGIPSGSGAMQRETTPNPLFERHADLSCANRASA